MKSFFMCLNFLLMLNVLSFSQKKQVVQISGNIKSIDEKNLSAVSVSLYSIINHSIIDYSISEKNGNFLLKNVPERFNGYLIFTHEGFSSLKVFLEHGKSLEDLNNIRLVEKVSSIDTIKVLPPVYLNNDTLEFNADAFKLDPNAVVEDLLRVLPGVIVWGDGEITVNGKKVVNLYVNGKKFFTGDAKIATQNLSKSTIEKVQVYSSEQSKYAYSDSTYHMNLVLKEGKEFGVFGKFSVGKGTTSKFEDNIGLNFFNPKSQYAVGLNLNNVNFFPNSMNMYLRNNTYKSSVMERQLLTDFNALGINRSTMVGLFGQYDIKQFRADKKDKNQIELDFFRNKFDNILNSNEVISTTLSEGIQQYNSNVTVNSVNDDNKLNLKYNLINGKNEFLITYRYHSSDLTENYEDEKESKLNQEIIGSQTAEKNNHNLTTNNNLKIAYKNNLLELENSLGHEDYQSNQSINAIFKSTSANNFHEKRDKFFNNNTNVIQGFIITYLSDIFKIGNYQDSRSLKIEMKNEWDIKGKDINQQFLDQDFETNDLQLNPYLTNSRKNTHSQIVNNLILKKKFSKETDGLKSKSLTALINFRTILNNNVAKGSIEHSSYHLKHNYFIPKVSLFHEYVKFNRFIFIQSVELEANKLFPQYEQLVDVIDSVGVLFFKIPNINLNVSDIRKLSAKFNFISMKNNYFIDQGEFKLDLTKVNRPIIDSMIFDEVGKTSYYQINGRKSWNLYSHLNIKKSFNINNNLLQLYSNNMLNSLSGESYFQGLGLDITSSYLSLAIGGDFIGNFRGVTLKFEQKVNYFKMSQRGEIINNFETTDHLTKFGVTINLFNNISATSSIIYRTNSAYRSDGSVFINSYTFSWFLLNEKLKIEGSIFDLFNRNQIINNSLESNRIVSSSVMGLNQHFMLNLSYYPRWFFGKKKN